MNWWLKFGCILTGWNYQKLMQCSEASKSQLSKYTSALLILMIIWSVTGFCFAQRYVGLPVYGCIAVSVVFITLVVMIERQILLSQNPSMLMVWFRGIIAFMMAIVGSTIFDQTLFGKDIDKQMNETIEIQTAALTQKRVGQINDKLAALQAEKDKLSKSNEMLQSDVNAHPWIEQKSVTSSQQQLVVNGKLRIVNNPSVTTNQVANPKIETIKENNGKLQSIVSDEREWSRKKLTVEEDTRNECRQNVGFLEELEAMKTILFTRCVALFFYAVFFSLLMCLELFVVFSKKNDKECDYETAVRGEQEIRNAQFRLAYEKARHSSEYV